LRLLREERTSERGEERIAAAIATIAGVDKGSNTFDEQIDLKWELSRCEYE
jgi:hypothetical protein